MIMPIFACSKELLGNFISSEAKVVKTNPEQSKPLFVVPPALYFTPMLSVAVSISLFTSALFSLLVSLLPTAVDVDLQEANNRDRKRNRNNFFKTMVLSS